MAETMVYDKEAGVSRRVIRNDAVKHHDRWYVQTVYGRASGNTKWIANWDEFLAAGGTMLLSEDQTQIELFLPEGYKFACGFQRPSN